MSFWSRRRARRDARIIATMTDRELSALIADAVVYGISRSLGFQIPPAGLTLIRKDEPPEFDWSTLRPKKE